MNSAAKSASRLYKDIEKLYRLTGLYKGNREPLEQHVRLIDMNLETHLRSTTATSIRWDFLMSGVYFEGDSIFHSDFPEMTLAFALYCDSVESIQLSKEVRGEELLNWCLGIRSYFDHTSNSPDLASLLWKNPYPHIRVYLYNRLLSGEGLEIITDQARLSRLTKATEEMDKATEVAIRDWHNRDWQWEVPSGDLVYEKVYRGDEDITSLKRLKEELADAAITDRAKHLVRFREEELEELKGELESYDQNQIEFNLLVLFFDLLKNHPKSKDATASLELMIDSLNRFASSIIARFQGGLILFLIKNIQVLENNPALKSIQTRLQKSLIDAISSAANLKVIAEAFTDKNRIEIASQLIPYLQRDCWGMLFDFIMEKNSDFGLKNLLMIVVKDNEADQFLFQLGEARLLKAIPILTSFDWPLKEKFVSRCLLGRSHSLMRACLPFLVQLSLSSRTAFELFDRLESGDRKLFVEAFLGPYFSNHWVAFVREVIASGKWAEDSRDLMYLWVKVAFKFLGVRSFEIFENYLHAKKFFFWARFPKQREAILTMAQQVKQPELQTAIRRWLEKDKGQSSAQRDKMVKEA